MKYFFFSILFTMSCSDLVSENQETPIGNVDYCEQFGWYGDGRCDTNCKKPDPDCGPVTPPACMDTPTRFRVEDPTCNPDQFLCPQGAQYYEDECQRCGCIGGTQPPLCRENPDVNYVGKGEECERIDYACPPNSDYYADDCGCGCISDPTCEENPDVNYVAKGEECTRIDFGCEPGIYEYYQDDCGCGCIKINRMCEYDDPNIFWYDTDPEICSLENIRPACPPDTRYFENECGCGCRFEVCTNDSDCVGGFCETQLEQPTCRFAQECGDGQPTVCDAIPQPCPAGRVRESKNGCWGECVSARTCQFVCEEDAQCVDLGLGNICIFPECPDVDGIICESACHSVVG